MARVPPVYRPRDAEAAVLHTVIREHLDDFLRAAADPEGGGLPPFVEREFREFLTCGVLAHGFARLRCEGCAFERLLPFSCKGRGFCPSCGGRRMTERAAHLVDAVLPWVPVRQWVLTLPYRLRYQLAWNHRLCLAVLGVYARTLLAFYARRARHDGIPQGQSGTVTVIQRFGSGLNLNVHFHTLALDGVFSEATPGQLTFHPAAPPSDEEVATVLATVRRRVRRLLARRGLEPGDDGTSPVDPLAQVSPTLAGLAAASVQGRVALGAQAGGRVRRVGQAVAPTPRPAPGPRQAHLEGFDLHADLRVPARDRARLDRVCRYLLRPPLAQERVRLRPDGRVLVELKAPWRDGTTALLFEPLEFLEKLAAITPRPAINLLVYHGVLAPHAPARRQVVGYGRPARETPVPFPAGSGADPAGAEVPRPPRHWAWAALLHRAFALDALACDRCGGRLRLLATLSDPDVIRQLLAHRDRRRAAEPLAPGPAPPASPDPAVGR